MNDDFTILLTGKSIVSMSSNNTVASSIITSTVNNYIERLEKHIDYLHTKIGDMEERIAILESIVLKKD